MELKSVTVKGRPLADVVEAEVSMATPVRDGGYPHEGARAARLVLVREGLNSPAPDGFGLATNDDGRTEFVEARVEFQNSLGATTYTVAAEDAYVQTFRLHCPDDESQPVTETWVIRAGKTKLHAAGKAPEHGVPHFKR